MNELRSTARYKSPHQYVVGRIIGLLVIVVCVGSACALAAGPLAAKVKVTTSGGYSGTATLPKPDKILIYDLVADPSDVQVDSTQKIRPRHMIAGDENPEAVTHKAQHTFSEELEKRLTKTGLPVQHVAADTAPSDNSLVVQGAFTSLHEGTKTERGVVGMGTGSASVQTKIDVHLKTPAEAILLSQFQTETTPAKNVGGAVPVAVGMNPAAVAAKSTISDRKKTLYAYASKTADATAGEVMKAMAQQGWIKLNDKGEVIQ